VYPTHTPGAQPTLIVFQFNPESMKRTLAHRAIPPPSDGKTGTPKEDLLRVAGPPVETINLTVEMHAADQLEQPDDEKNAAVASDGLHPALAALELLMYPPAADTQKLDEQAQKGTAQVSLSELPLVLLVWGKSRVVPVKLTSFAISEDAFDTRLNPIAARVDLGMQVISSMEFTGKSIGADAFVTYQQAKETLARHNRPGSSEAGIRNLLPH
jgi:hypothetical protein